MIADIVTHTVRTNETRRTQPAGFFVRKVADVAILSKELCASSRTFAGRERSDRTAVEGNPGTGGLDRGHRLEGEAAQQIKRLTDDPADRGAQFFRGAR